MDLDKLIKLVKLANNNPNENEANSAARRACKLIADGDYKFVKDMPIVYMSSTPLGSNPFADLFRQQQNMYNNVYNPPVTRIVTCKECGKNVAIEYNISPDDFLCIGCFTKYKYNEGRKKEK